RRLDGVELGLDQRVVGLDRLRGLGLLARVVREHVVVQQGAVLVRLGARQAEMRERLSRRLKRLLDLGVDLAEAGDADHGYDRQSEDEAAGKRQDLRLHGEAHTGGQSFMSY